MAIGATPWLTEAELDVYVSEWGRTRFQGALNFYRVFVDPSLIAQFRLFAGRTIDVPSAFCGGKSDWAVYMTPGAVDVMRSRACTRMQEYALLDGAGHWLQQEQPDPVCSALGELSAQQYGTFATALGTFSQFLAAAVVSR